MDPLIEKQFKKWGLSKLCLPTDLREWNQFLNLVEVLFEEKERNEYLLEKALEICTSELNLLQKDNLAKDDPLYSAHLEHRLRHEASTRKEVDVLNRNLQLQKELANQLAKEADSANRAKSMFLSNMSHEFRSPMNAVIGMAAILKETNLCEEQQEFVQSIECHGRNLLELINDVIDYSKIESGSIQLDHSEFEPMTALNEILSNYSALAEKKGLRFMSTIHPRIPEKLSGDFLRIEQIWSCLIENAFKFTQKGFVHLELQVEPIGKRLLQLKTIVRDSGIGIDKALVEDLFAAFVQADNTATRQYGGSGLGLAISKRLAQMMGGDILYRDAENEGSEFEFTCMVSVTDNTPSVFGSDNTLHDFPLRIEVVDPNPLSRRNYRQILKFWKLSYQSYGDIETILSSSARKRAGLVLVHSDAIFESNKSIADVVSHFRTEENQLVIVGLSEEEKSRIKNEHGIHVIDEPLDPRDLNRLIRKVGNEVHSTESYTKARNLSFCSQDSSRGFGFSERFPLQILLVEDSPINQKVTRFMLKKLGYEVEVASTGLEAVESFSEHFYDLILMDLQMPVMSGVEACGLILNDLKANKCPYICALTANVSVEDQLICREVKMNDFMPKPLSLENLKDVLRKAYTHQQSRQMSEGGSNAIGVSPPVSSGN